jgi:hypothetical protein
MKQVVVTIPVEEIIDWNSFHDVFQRSLGFPEFYGRNMNAWIDCMTDLDAPNHGMTTVHVPPGEILILRIDHPFEFKVRCLEQYEALLECSAFVNFRRVEVGELPVLALLLNGRYDQ